MTRHALGWSANLGAPLVACALLAATTSAQDGTAGTGGKRKAADYWREVLACERRGRPQDLCYSRNRKEPQEEDDPSTELTCVHV